MTKKNPPNLRDKAGTPWEIIRAIEHHWDVKFDLDVCAEKRTAKAESYLTVKEDGLKHWWKCENAWCNPPYSKGQQELWFRKALEEVNKKHCKSAFLWLPADMSTSLGDEIARAPYIDVWLVNPRVQHIPPPGIKYSSSNFGNKLVVMGKAACSLGNPDAYIGYWNWERTLEEMVYEKE